MSTLQTNHHLDLGLFFPPSNIYDFHQPDCEAEVPGRYEVTPWPLCLVSLTWCVSECECAIRVWCWNGDGELSTDKTGNTNKVQHRNRTWVMQKWWAVREWTSCNSLPSLSVLSYRGFFSGLNIQMLKYSNP